jgi:hypothetical protein
MSAELTYCEECELNLEESKFDYRFDRPVCLGCVEKNADLEHELNKCDRGECQTCYPEPERCETHTWVLQLNMPNTPTQNWCEECGATEPADPEDVAEQIRLLGEND